MEVRVNVEEKFLKAAAGLLVVSLDGAEDEELLDAVVQDCAGTVVKVDANDFSSGEMKQLSIALAMYAIGKEIEKRRKK